MTCKTCPCKFEFEVRAFVGLIRGQICESIEAIKEGSGEPINVVINAVVNNNDDNFYDAEHIAHIRKANALIKILENASYVVNLKPQDNYIFEVTKN